MKRRRTVSKAPPPVESTLASINSIIDGTCLHCSKPIPPDSASDIYCAKVQHYPLCCSLKSECTCRYAKHLPGECSCEGGELITCQDAAGAATSEPLPTLRRGGVCRPDPEAAVRMTPTWRFHYPAAHYIDSSWAGIEQLPSLAGGPRLWKYTVRLGCSCGHVCVGSAPFDGFARSSEQFVTRLRGDLMAGCGRAFAEHALPGLTGGYHGLDTTELVSRGDGPVGYPAGGTIIFRCRCGYGVRASGTDLDGTWVRTKHAFEEHRRENPPPSQIPFDTHPSTFADVAHPGEHVSVGFDTRSVLMAAGELEGARRRAAEASAGGDVTYVVDDVSGEQENHGS